MYNNSCLRMRNRGKSKGVREIIEKNGRRQACGRSITLESGVRRLLLAERRDNVAGLLAAVGGALVAVGDRIAGNLAGRDIAGP